jgi:hypothetical protein
VSNKEAREDVSRGTQEGPKTNSRGKLGELLTKDIKNPTKKSKV